MNRTTKDIQQQNIDEEEVSLNIVSEAEKREAEIFHIKGPLIFWISMCHTK